VYIFIFLSFIFILQLRDDGQVIITVSHPGNSKLYQRLAFISSKKKMDNREKERGGGN
jgi:hypothetical protein